MTTTKILILQPAGGVAFNQLKDGSIRCYVSPHNGEMFRRNVLRLADEINQYLITHLESQKKVETVQHALPKSRIQVLEEEIARLKLEPHADNTIIIGGFEPDDGALPKPAAL